MEIIVNNAILHIAAGVGGTSHISDAELDIDSDVCYEFVCKHIKKMMNNTSAKEAVFNPGSETLAITRAFIEGELYFKEASARICEKLLAIMTENEDIPPADVLVAQFETRNRGGRKAESLLAGEYLAVLKLNHKECFTHRVDEAGSGKDNQLVKYREVLPFESGKVEEGCVISYEPMLIRLVEKPYSIGGEPTNYFSELFLDCATELSKTETARIIDDITEEINEKYSGGSVQSAAKLKVAIIDEAIEEEGVLSLYNVARRAFPDNEEARAELAELAKEAGIKPDAELGEKFLRRQFGTQKFRATNGMELKFPAELSDDADAMEFTENPDGSVSILLKNLRRS